MTASLDISMYPLREDYKQPILEFIDRLRQYEELDVQANNLSTQVFGDYDRMLEILRVEMKKSMSDDPTVVMVLKIVNADVR